MRQILKSRAVRSVCYTLVVALVSSLAPAPFTTAARADNMPMYSVGVVDFVNESGVQGELLSRLATDAVVVEMAKTNRYEVSITRTLIKTEMDKLDLHPPLTKVGLVRLGEALQADAMLEGSIKSVQLAGTGPTRRASVTMVIQLVDQASGEIINGAVQTGSSSSRPGYVPDDDSLITEAINSAAFLAVKTMADYVIPEATIMMNIQSSQVMLNRGARDGIKAGMRMIVLRRKEIIGYVEIQNVSAMDSMAKVIKSMRGIKPEDKARAIFEMPTVGPTAKSEPLPSGAPKGGGGRGNALGKIAKVLIGAGIVFGLVSLFRGGRGSEPAPTISAAADTATMIRWDSSGFGHGQNVLEYQIMRDDFADGARPVKAMRDPSEIDAGHADVYRLYGTAAGTNVSYYTLGASPASSFSEVTWTVPAEPFGTTHTYQVRVVYKLQHTTGTGTSTTTTTTAANTYYYTPVSNTIAATAIDSVKASDVVSPAYDANVGPPEILVTDLQQGSTNFEWNRKDGADVYYVRIEPVVPGTGPTWQSPVIYETGPIVSLPAGMRTDLANLLSNSAYADKVMRWVVYCRHQSDTSPAWLAGQEARFVIGNAPPNFP